MSIDLKFRPMSLRALMPIERERLTALTNPPRHPGDESMFVQLLRATNPYQSPPHPFFPCTLFALVAIEDDRWVGWTLVWWRFDEQVARIGVFVDRDHRNQGIGTALLTKIQTTMTSFGMRLRANATADEAARLFERLGIENDARLRAGTLTVP